MKFINAIERHRRRSRQSQIVDEALQATKQFRRTDEGGIARWSAKVNRSDVTGIDSRRPMIGFTVKQKVFPFNPPKNERTVFPIHPASKRHERFAKSVQYYTNNKFAGDRRNIVAKKINVLRGLQGVRGAAGWFRKTGKKEATVAIAPKQVSQHDQELTILHEFTHARKAFDKRALAPRQFEKDSEEKQTVLEAGARFGHKGLGNSKMAGYYFYTGKKYPKAALEDLKKMRLSTAKGLTNSRKIERNMLKHFDKTHLSKHRIAIGRVTDAGRAAENIDTYYGTTEGEFWHFYSPNAMISPQSTANFIDRYDGKKKEESVYQYRDDGSRKYLVRRNKRYR